MRCLRLKKILEKVFLKNSYLPHRLRRLFCKVEVELYFLFLSGIQGLFWESQLWIGTRLRLLSLDLVDEFPRRQANLLKFPRTEKKKKIGKKSILRKSQCCRKRQFRGKQFSKSILLSKSVGGKILKNPWKWNW